MYKRLLVIPLLVAACSSDTGLNRGSDGGVDGATASPDMTVAGPPGARIFNGDLSLQGVTTDNWAIVVDNQMGSVKAIPLDASLGQAQQIADQGDAVIVDGSAAIVFTFLNQMSPQAAMTVWTAKTGATALAQKGRFPMYALAPDGSAIFYAENTSDDGMTADLMAAGIDGKNAQTIAQAVYVGRPCRPSAAFAGTSTVVYTHCPAAPTSAMMAPPVSLSMFSLGMKTPPVDITTDAKANFSIDKAGDKLAFLSSTGSLWVVGPLGVKPVKYDDNVVDLYLLRDGSAVLYTVSSKAVKRAATTGAIAPTTLVAGVGQYLQNPTRDDKFILFADNYDQNTGLTDLYVASTATPGVPAVASTKATAMVFGDAFTADQSRALWAVNVDPQQGIGTLQTVADAGGMPSTFTGNDAWEVWAAQGTTVAYNDNYKATRTYQRADIKTLDVAAAGAKPTLLVAGADANFYLDAPHTSVVFTWGVDGSKAGLYLAPLH